MKRFIMLFTLLYLLAPGICGAAASTPANQELLIFYSNDVIGETEPCG